MDIAIEYILKIFVIIIVLFAGTFIYVKIQMLPLYRKMERALEKKPWIKTIIFILFHGCLFFYAINRMK